MKAMGLKGYISKSGSRKYNSYKGSIGKVADNVVKRNFNPERPTKFGALTSLSSSFHHAMI